MSGPSPVSHYFAVAEEFVEVGEIAPVGFTELEALGFDALGFDVLVFDAVFRTAYSSHGGK